MEWEVSYLTEEKDLNENGHDTEYIEWVEDHNNPVVSFWLSKFKTDQEHLNFSYTYSLVLVGMEASSWAESHFHLYESVVKKSRYIFLSNQLEPLVQFIEDIKKEMN